MRTFLLRLLLPVLACGGYAAWTAAPARAETLEDYAVTLGEWRARAQLWMRLAERDPASDTIDRYKAQTAEDFKKKDHVEAEDLVGILADKAKDFEVRNAAAEALKSAGARDADPDIQPPAKRGAASPRGKFALEELIPLLTSKKSDRITRTLAHEILKAWLGSGRGKNQSAIDNFKWDDEKTWGPAANAWKEAAREG